MRTSCDVLTGGSDSLALSTCERANRRVPPSLSDERSASGAKDGVALRERILRNSFRNELTRVAHRIGVDHASRA